MTAIASSSPQGVADAPSSDAELAAEIERRVGEARWWCGNTRLGDEYVAAVRAAGAVLGLGANAPAALFPERVLVGDVLKARPGCTEDWLVLRRRMVGIMIAILEDEDLYLTPDLYALYDAIQNVHATLYEAE